MLIEVVGISFVGGFVEQVGAVAGLPSARARRSYSIGGDFESRRRITDKCPELGTCDV